VDRATGASSRATGGKDEFMLRTKSPKITIVTTLAACLLLGTTLVAAAPPPGPMNGPDPARFAARFLDLSDLQVQAWRGILEARDEATRPIVREVERRERQLQGLLDAEAPDPAAVGALVVAIDGLRDQIDSIRESSGQELLGTLEDDQLLRVEDAAAAAPLVPAVHSLRALGLI
jgi:hypothetical protein